MHATQPVTLTRLSDLQKYNDTALVLGTSAFVGLSQHGCSPLSAMAGVKDRFGENGFELVALNPVANEYKTLYDRRVSGYDGTPKTSIDIFYSITSTPIPHSIHSILGPSAKLWREYSEKAKKPRKAEDSELSWPDLTVIAYVNTLAEQGRECFVFTYDEHEAGPIKYLASKFPNIHLAEESLQTAPRLIKETGSKGATPLLMYPHVAGQLYSMETTKEPTHYLLTAKAPFAGKPEEIGVSVLPINGKLEFSEGDISRHILLVSDLDEFLESANTRRGDMILDRLNANSERFGTAVMGRYPYNSIIVVAKSRKYPVMRVSKLERHLMFSGGRLEPESESTELEWLSLDSNYIKKFLPKTGEYLRDFRKRIPK